MLYIPPGTQSLDKVTVLPQVRCGIQGYPKTGKTFAAMTFPNPVVMNLDRGLGAFIGRPDIIDVPFYNPAFVDSVMKLTIPAYRRDEKKPANVRDAVLIWLSKEAPKLTSEQTLVLDGNTGLESAHDRQYNEEPAVVNGKIDKWGIFRQRNTYFNDVWDALKTLSCNVVYLCHETADRDTDGGLNGLVRPLLGGQAGDKLAGAMTDWVRSYAFEKPRTEEQLEKALKYFGVDKATLAEWCKSGSDYSFYLWQCHPDNVAKTGVSSLVNAPKFVLATYDSFKKYRRKLI